jgi:HlyD family secretion protein
MVDYARPESVLRKKKMKQAAYGVGALTAILLITVGVSRLRPAAPSVERATVWVDTVKQGPMVRQVRGTGTLVPEENRWIPATTAGRVEHIVLRSGAPVTRRSRKTASSTRSTRRSAGPTPRTSGIASSSNSSG